MSFTKEDLERREKKYSKTPPVLAPSAPEQLVPTPSSFMPERDVESTVAELNDVVYKKPSDVTAPPISPTDVDEPKNTEPSMPANTSLADNAESKSVETPPSHESLSDSARGRVWEAWRDEPAVVVAYRVLEAELPESFISGQINKVIDATNIVPGSVGVPYECIIDFSSLQEKLIIVGCRVNPILADIGLDIKMSGNRLRLVGIPCKPHDAKVYFCYGKTSFVQGKDVVSNANYGKDELPYLHSPKELIINDDPRNLWQDLAVEDYEGYKNKDNDNAGAEFEVEIEPEVKRTFRSNIPAKKEKIEIIAASRRGRSHAHAAKPRDDYFYYEIDKETGWNFVAVADGAGSAKYSRKGSEIACETVVKQLHGMMNAEFDAFLRSEALLHFTKSKAEFVKTGGNWEGSQLQSFARATKLEPIFHKAVDSAIRAIHDEAKKRGAVVKDYHTTLLCTAFKYFGQKKTELEMSGWFFASYWVGDGGAALLRWNDTDRVLVLGEPDGGEFAGQTRFLTIPDEIQPEMIKKRVRFSFCDTFSALLLVTDGITDPFFPSEAAVADEHRWLEFYEQKLKNGCVEEPQGCPILFDPNQSPAKKSEDLLHWLNFWSKGNHDDRTILVVKPQ